MKYTIDASKAHKQIVSGTLKMGGENSQGDSISFTNYYMEFNGKPYIAICGEFHYARYFEPDWSIEIAKMKASGINTIATYIFWNHHEEQEGQFNWSGNRDLRRFVEICAEQDLHVILRVGPFCHGEVRNGGLPDWLFGRTFELRSNDEGYLAYVSRLYHEIGDQVQGLMFKDGGPVIGIQLENELNAASAPWEMTTKQGDEYIFGGESGEAGIQHMRHLKNLAVEAGLETPIYTSTGWDTSPILEDEVLPLYGGYAYTPWSVTAENPDQVPTGEYVFVDYHNNKTESRNFSPDYDKERYPFACCEMGGGMQSWYLSRFQVEAESVSAMSLMKLAGGCNFVGYYMYHGGTNPMGSTGFLNENTTPRFSYDFQATIGEFGQNRRSNDLLRPIHYFLRAFGERLAPTATVLPADAASIQPSTADKLRYAVRSDGTRGFLFVNNYQDHVVMARHDNVVFEVETAAGTLSFPRRQSLSVLPHASFMFPLRFDLGGAELLAATCTPVTQQGNTTFFRMGDQTGAELLLDASAIAEVTASHGAVELDADGVYVVQIAHDQSSMVSITTKAGKQMKLYVMTAAEAANLWELEWQGKQLLLFSDAAASIDNGELTFLSTGEASFSFKAFVGGEAAESAIVGESAGTGSEIAALIAALRPEAGKMTRIELADSFAEDFVAYRMDLAPQAVELRTEKIQDHKLAVYVDEAVLDQVHEVLLSIDYTGNVGYAFTDGKLFHDNFYNGQPWEIGLSRFRSQLEHQPIVLVTTPLRKGKVTIAADAAMAIGKSFEGESIAEFRGVSAAPVYRVGLS